MLKRPVVAGLLIVGALAAVPSAQIAAAAPKAAPSITVSPNSKLGLADTVNVTGKGFAAGSALFMAVCKKGADLGPDGCQPDPYLAFPDADGAFSTTGVADRVLLIDGARYDCAPKNCEYVVGDYPANTTVARAAVSFDTTPLPPPLKATAVLSRQGKYDPVTGEAQVTFKVTCNRDAFDAFQLDFVQYFGRFIFRSFAFAEGQCFKGVSTATVIFEPTTGKFGKGKASVNGLFGASSTPDQVQSTISGDVILSKGTITPPPPAKAHGTRTTWLSH